MFYHADHLGSGTILTNPHGEVSQVLSYMPFGEELLNVTDKTYSTPYRFTGHEKDEESGLHYAHARYLSTDLSIFLSVDPMYMKYPALTPYHYCGNNPVARVDLDGMDVAILIAKDGASGNGHMGAVIQDKDGGYYYLTGGNADPEATLFAMCSSGTQGGLCIMSLDVNDMNEAINEVKAFDTSNSTYTDHVVLKTTKDTDNKIYNNSVQLKKDVDSGKSKYNVLTNNCSDFCSGYY